MELKYKFASYRDALETRSNCTFMELKFVCLFLLAEGAETF